MPALPLPVLDHVVVNVRERIDAGEAVYRRLGFALTPRGYHTLGSVNHLAVFATDYLELISAPASATGRYEILAAPEGLNALVFATEDSAATYASLQAAGLPVGPPVEFSRPVSLPRGSRDAVFRNVRLLPGTAAPGRLYFCHHFTPDLVWRDEWRRHPNGVIGIVRAVIAVRDPGQLGTLFSRMFGLDTVRAEPGGCTLLLGLARCEVRTPEAVRAEFAAAAPPEDGRTEFMAALTLRTTSLDHAAAALAAGGIAARREPDRLIVPASAAFGVTLEFVP
jgi:Glyoxalase-like domain